MPFYEAVRIAVASLRANKLRSFLTVLGILIGVSSVVAVVAITSGLDRYIGDKVLELGGKSFSVQKMPDIITSRQQFLEMIRRKDVTYADALAVQRGCDACGEVGVLVTMGANAKYGRESQGLRVMGISENFPRIGTPREVIAGRHLIAEDDDQARAVAVIGTDVVDALFGEMEPLGKEISINGRRLRVIGVAEKKGSVFGNSQDNFAWVPFSTFRKYFGRRQSVTIQAEAADPRDFELAQDQARVVMRVRRHLDFGQEEDFSIETGQSVMDLWQSATAGIYVTTFVVTAISLVVGGIVVMNIMLVSVTERIREIGVRKALGARRRDIMRQFLVEAVLLSVFGGGLGVLGAAVFSFGLGKVLSGIMATDFTAPVQAWAVAVAIAVSTVVGLVAGLYPASRAAALDPVNALRQE
ncbi:MAG: ABC transporter permease [Vicinamibacteria bacterium]|nr:ABC transporter permease [Vicinamibacteria bacterium]